MIFNQIQIFGSNSGYNHGVIEQVQDFQGRSSPSDHFQDRNDRCRVSAAQCPTINRNYPLICQHSSWHTLCAPSRPRVAC
jgi:hypothetical protein